MLQAKRRSDLLQVDAKSQSLLSGRKGLVVGIANEDSIAYGCARMFRNCGAELAVTWLNDKARPYVEPLARELSATITVPLDVEQAGAMEAVFDAIRERWGRLDFLLHSIAYAPSARPSRSGGGHVARGLRPRDGHLMPFVHAHGAARRTADGRGRHAAHHDLSRRRRGGPALRRDGPGEGRARSGRPLPCD